MLYWLKDFKCNEFLLWNIVSFIRIKMGVIFIILKKPRNKMLRGFIITQILSQLKSTFIIGSLTMNCEIQSRIFFFFLNFYRRDQIDYCQH